MKRCIEIAKALYDPLHPIRTFHVSFIVHKRKIITIGLNKQKTDPKNLIHAPFEKGVCSERDAITKFLNKSSIDINQCRLINVRVDRNQKINFSKPCKTCQNLLMQYNFKEVLFTDKGGEFKKFL